jgi:hypothetical protein
VLDFLTKADFSLPILIATCKIVAELELSSSDASRFDQLSPRTAWPR